MRHVLPLYAMAPEASFYGTVLVEGALSPFEVAQRIKEAMEPSQDDASVLLKFMYPMPGHPSMWPEPGYIVFVSFPFLCLLFN